MSLWNDGALGFDKEVVPATRGVVILDQFVIQMREGNQASKDKNWMWARVQTCWRERCCTKNCCDEMTWVTTTSRLWPHDGKSMRLNSLCTAKNNKHQTDSFLSMTLVLSVMVLVYKSLHRLALPYLSDDCQLVTDVGRRHLRSADVHTCTVPEHSQGSVIEVLGSPDHGYGTVCPLNCDSKTRHLPHQV